MRTILRKAQAGVAFVLLISSPTFGADPSDPNKPATRAAGTVTRTRQQQLEARTSVLNRDELKRQQIISGLEFIPRRPLPGLVPRFPFFCLIPPPTLATAIDPHRSLFVHDRATLDAKDFSLGKTLGQIASQVSVLVPGTTAVSSFKQFWDTQNAAPGQTSGPHCTDAGGMVNGFPITCPRAEGQEAVGAVSDIQKTMDEYKILALVNRIDLAHEGWRNCGEYRMVYGKRASPIAKNLMIFEAVLPNPRPGCREGCLPVAEFWKSLSAIDDAGTRAEKLQMFYYTGLPGFRPVVHVDHYSATGVSTTYGSSGSGQIRTNQFLQFLWTLKEFKTVIDCGVTPCQFNFVPISVKVNPPGGLWNEDNADPRAVDFRADTLLQTATLGSGSLMGIGYGVDLANDAGQSVAQGASDDYRANMNAAAATAFRTALPFGGLTADQMASRALTQSCAGCHQPLNFGLTLPDSIGTVTTPGGSPVPTVDSWPGVVSAGFVHVDVMPASIRPELAANPAAFGSGTGQEISQALLDFFLPARKGFLLNQLNSARCPCVRRFGFLPVAKQRLALGIEDRVQLRFADRFAKLELRMAEAQAKDLSAREMASLEQEHGRLMAERDAEVSVELKRNGITLPDPDVPDLKPQFLKLKAGSLAKGQPPRSWDLRIDEVNRLIQEEPARRTVTGSFRVH